VIFLVVGLVLAYGVWTLNWLRLAVLRWLRREQVCMAVVTLKEYSPAEIVKNFVAVSAFVFPARPIVQDVRRPEMWIFGVRVGDHYDIVKVPDYKLYRSTDEGDQVLVCCRRSWLTSHLRVVSLV
jgi:hypothetical protein